MVKLTFEFYFLMIKKSRWLEPLESTLLQTRSRGLVFGSFCLCQCILYHPYFLLDFPKTDASCENIWSCSFWDPTEIETTHRKERSSCALFTGLISHYFFDLNVNEIFKLVLPLLYAITVLSFTYTIAQTVVIWTLQ